MKTKILSIVAVVLIGLAFSVGMYVGKKSTSPEEPAVTTIYSTKVDTVFVDVPKIVDRVVYKKEFVSVVDTFRVHDTLYVALNRERIESRDSTHRLIVSGINPSIDFLEIYNRTEYVDRIVNNFQYDTKKTKWGVGVQVGYGVTVNEVPSFTPYIGLGIQYNLFSF